MTAKADKNPIRWQAVKGRNGWDAPSALLDDMAAEAVNVTFRRGTLGAKRHGSSERTLTGSFGDFRQMARFVPGQSDPAAELIALDDTAKILRIAAGTSVASLTVPETPSATGYATATFATCNGKCYISYTTSTNTNRLKVFDPGISTTIVRFVGLATPAAPTVTNTGSGTYAAVARYYKQQWRVKSGSTIQRQGALSAASTVFTPSGSGTAAHVTKAAATSAPAEGETHWALYGSIDNTNYFYLAETVVGTTTYDDSADPNTYNTAAAAPLSGDITQWPSVKFLCATENRLLGFGAWATTAGDGMPPKPGRVWFSPPLDTSDADDDERVQNSSAFKGYIDVGRNVGAEDRGIVGPVNGQILVGQSRGLTILTETGDGTKPLARTTLTKSLGMLTHWSSFVGEDEAGDPCMYFLDPALGPYRYGKRGLEWLGYDVQDIWATIDLSASGFIPAHGVYHQATRQCWWWLTSTNGSGFPDTLIIFHVREGVPTEREGVRYGWATFTGTNITQAACSVMFANTFGATMSRDLVPYFGTISTGKLVKADDSTATADYLGTGIQAYVTSKAWDIAPPHHDKTLQFAYLQAAAASGVTITQTILKNFNDESRAATTSLTATAAGESRVLRRFEGAALAEAFTFQVRLGDGSAASNAWTLDQWMGAIEVDDKPHSNP